MLEEGRGSPPNSAAAVELYRAAADQNFAPARNNLGILLAEGRGAAVDLSQAFAWLSVAAENGAKPTGRDIVTQQLTSAQLAEAKTALAKLRTQLNLTPPAAPPAILADLPAQPPPVAPSARVEDYAAINGRLAKLQSDLEKLRSENARLIASAEALAKEKAELEERLRKASAPAAQVPDPARENLPSRFPAWRPRLTSRAKTPRNSPRKTSG
jgi:TPR repeat protein